jgi:hypothetical protein
MAPACLRNVALARTARRLEVAFFGPVDYRDRLETLELILERVAQEGIRRVLLDFSAAWHRLPTEEAMAAFEARLVADATLRGACVAFVNCPDAHTQPTQSAGRAVGFAVRAFRSRNEALDWLDRCRPV